MELLKNDYNFNLMLNASLAPTTLFDGYQVYIITFLYLSITIHKTFDERMQDL